MWNNKIVMLIRYLKEKWYWFVFDLIIFIVVKNNVFGFILLCMIYYFIVWNFYVLSNNLRIILVLRCNIMCFINKIINIKGICICMFKIYFFVIYR